MSADLPAFRYHPDPLASGSIRESTEACACCKPQHGVDLYRNLLHHPRGQRTPVPLVHLRRQRG
ncbi:CbrC family protein [Streptomyces sp. NPDC055817]